MMANPLSDDEAFSKMFSSRFLIIPKNHPGGSNSSALDSSPKNHPGGSNSSALDSSSQQLFKKNKSSQLPSKSATFIAENEELLSQILIKLPPKPLLRFQCVSKAWLSLISKPDFRRCWSAIRRNSGTVSLLFCPMGIKDIGILSLGSEGVVSPPALFNSNPLKGFIKDEVDIYIHGCNGVWCIQPGEDFDRISFRGDFDLMSIVVCNPTTGQHRKILIPHGTDWPKVRYSNIAFDPQKSDHYKLVCWVTDRMGYHRFMVYSSESAKWRVTDDHLGNKSRIDFDYFCENGIFWNGDLYFIGRGESDEISVICFDVEHEIRPSVPQIPSIGSDISYFGEAGGDLCIVSLNNSESFTEFDVFALIRDHSEWALKYRFDVAPLIATYPDMERLEFCISSLIVRGERAMVIISLAGKVVSCDISSMMVDELVEFEGKFENYIWNNVFQHVESLALV
ncbi:OLC1v1038724C1 [Oldenlandia corymbosa var. corymbosa]|uniref:OLC1v1038724C1 n=1 Tax=Oldenlandia corymbosa var. corymbosa TaxID=529605 RepID=A0AAV1D354_OLDCO|nr:OLC1v1038724C1 [Oldenlandia corymbosa var. corymbosa]